MSYSITTIMHPYADKQNLHKLIIQVIYNRMKVYVPTMYKVREEEFEKGAVIKHKNRKTYNDGISEQRNVIEAKLLDAMRGDRIKTKTDLTETIKGKINRDSVFEYVMDVAEKLKTKLSEGRIKHYKAVGRKIEDYAPGVTFGHISIAWINEFERHLREKGLDGNTVLSNMSLLIAIFNKANEQGLIDHKQYKGYKRPVYNQKLVEYLTEDELLKIKSAVDLTDRAAHKRAGYYFLLSAFTGYRISDSKRFNYDEMVKGNMIVLRATKNKQIISIPLYPQLREVIEYVRHNPLDLSEDKTRQYVKEICKFVGIKKEVKFHAARHSFAMFLISKGFSIDEVAALLGDSPEIARVYARISNTHLKDKFNERLGR